MNPQLEQYYDYIDEYNTHQSEPERQQGNVLGDESPTNHQTKKQILQMNTNKLLKAFGYWIVSNLLINAVLFLLTLVWQLMADTQAYDLSEYTTHIGWIELIVGCVAAFIAYEELLIEEELSND